MESHGLFGKFLLFYQNYPNLSEYIKNTCQFEKRVSNFEISLGRQSEIFWRKQTQTNLKDKKLEPNLNIEPILGMQKLP